MSNELPGRDRLMELARQRSKLQPVEKAALAYARWQGLTHEADVDTDAAKAELDRLIDPMEPDDWQPLSGLIGSLDDQLLKGLMSYSIKRSQEHMQERSSALKRALTRKPKKSKKLDKGL